MRFIQAAIATAVALYFLGSKGLRWIVDADRLSDHWDGSADAWMALALVVIAPVVLLIGWAMIRRATSGETTSSTYRRDQHAPNRDHSRYRGRY